MGVWGGLNSLPVHRLTKTKKKISRKHHDIYNSLNEKLIEVCFNITLLTSRTTISSNYVKP